MNAICTSSIPIKFVKLNNGKLEVKSCVADDNGKVVSITIDGYQVNVSNNSIYLIFYL